MQELDNSGAREWRLRGPAMRQWFTGAKKSRHRLEGRDSAWCLRWTRKIGPTSDYSPHPLDSMGIYAVYQTLNP